MPFEHELLAVHARLDMAEQIFVGPDGAAWRARHPLDIERAFRLHAREFLDWAIFGNNVAVAPDAGPMASAQGEGCERQQLQGCKGPDGDGAHRNGLFASETTRPPVLDSEICGLAGLGIANAEARMTKENYGLR